MGYPYGQKGWKVYDLKTHEFFVSWDVTFFENQFLFHHTEIASTSSISIIDAANLENQIDDRPANQNESLVEQILDDKGGTDTTEVVVTDTTVFPEPPDIQIPKAHDENEPLGRGCRVKYPSTRLQDYVKHTIQKLSPSARSSA